MARLFRDASFHAAYARLEPTVRRAVDAAIDKFAAVRHENRVPVGARQRTLASAVARLEDDVGCPGGQWPGVRDRRRLWDCGEGLVVKRRVLRRPPG